MKGRFFVVGVGPGDPELLTVKAIKTIEKADVVVVPKSHTTEDSTAHNIAKGYIKENSELLPMSFPMQGKQTDWSAAWQENADIIKKHLNEGRTVVFITLGDSMFYSTAIYVLRIIEDAGYETESIPGITAFCAIASKAKFPIVEGDDTLLIMPATADDEIIDKAMQLGSNLVVMKVSYNGEIFDKLAQNGYDNAVMISRAGLPDEMITRDFKEFTDKKPNYLSTILARKN